MIRNREWQGRLLEQARQMMPEAKLEEFRKEFNLRILSTKNRKALLHDYTEKVGDVLKAIHRYRNEAYHRDKVRTETLSSAVIVLYDVATDLLKLLPLGTIGVSGGENWDDFCRRYGLSQPFDVLHGGLDKIVACLKEGVHLEVDSLAGSLSGHLDARLTQIEEAISFVAENSVGNLTPEQELVRIQFWAEHAVVPRDFGDPRLRSYSPKFTIKDIGRWRAAGAALKGRTGKLALFAEFAQLEVQIEPLEEKVHDVAGLVDQAIQLEIDRRRGK